MSALTSGPGIKSIGEVMAIVLVAVIMIGGTELLLHIFAVPQYVMPKPSEIGVALVTEFPLIAPHLGYTLVELFGGFAIGASVGLILAGVITQFPFVEKIVTPYILLLVTTPMLALVPLLILRFGFGYEPRIIAVALASGPMVMINAATGFRRVDSGKIALARSYGASTLQIFWKVRAPMALPMIFVGLMVGSIFGLLTAVGAEMVGGGFGLGNRLTSYSSMDPDAAVLRGRRDPLHFGHPHLRALLPAREEVRELGGLREDLLPGGIGIRKETTGTSTGE